MTEGQAPRYWTTDQVEEKVAQYRKEIAELEAWKVEAAKSLLKHGVTAGELLLNYEKMEAKFAKLVNETKVYREEIKSLTEANVHLVIALRQANDELEEIKGR